MTWGETLSVLFLDPMNNSNWSLRSFHCLLLCVFAFAMLCFPRLNAEPVSLTRTEAFELHDALMKLSPGLSPENTFFAADAINALSSDANAWRVGYGKLLVLRDAANAPGASPDLQTAFREADAKFAAVADSAKVYELPLLSITKEELKASVDPKTGLPAMSAMTLATIRRLLKAVPKAS